MTHDPLDTGYAIGAATIGRMTPAGCEATAHQDRTAQTRIHAGGVAARLVETGMLMSVSVYAAVQTKPEDLERHLSEESAVESGTERASTMYVLYHVYRILVRKTTIMTELLSSQEAGTALDSECAVRRSPIPLPDTSGSPFGGIPYGSESDVCHRAHSEP